MTRLRPGMPRFPALRGIAIGGEDIPGSDEEALAVLGHIDDGRESDCDLPGIDTTDGGLPIAAMVPQASSEQQQSDAGHMPFRASTCFWWNE